MGQQVATLPASIACSRGSVHAVHAAGMCCLLLVAAVAAGTTYHTLVVLRAQQPCWLLWSTVCTAHAVHGSLAVSAHATHRCRPSKVVLPTCTCCTRLLPLQGLAGHAICIALLEHAALLLDEVCWQLVMLQQVFACPCPCLNGWGALTVWAVRVGYIPVCRMASAWLLAIKLLMSCWQTGP